MSWTFSPAQHSRTKRKAVDVKDLLSDIQELVCDCGAVVTEEEITMLETINKNIWKRQEEYEDQLRDKLKAGIQARWTDTRRHSSETLSAETHRHELKHATAIAQGQEKEFKLVPGETPSHVNVMLRAETSPNCWKITHYMDEWGPISDMPNMYWGHILGVYKDDDYYTMFSIQT